MNIYDPADPLYSVEKNGWMLSMTVTIIVFTIVLFTTANPMFGAVVASGTGIGFQFLLPYYVVWQILEDETTGAEGSIHQGAAGVSLIVGSLAAFPGAIATRSVNWGLLVGGIVIAIVYALFARRYPKL